MLGYEPDVLSFSSIWQAISIPEDVESASLSFWYWPATREIFNNDWQASWIFDAGLNSPPLEEVLKVRSNAQRWLRHSADLSRYAGETITLYFTAVNDGVGNRQTYWYVDDVQVEICGSNSTMTTPVQPTQGPDEIYLMDLLKQTPTR